MIIASLSAAVLLAIGGDPSAGRALFIGARPFQAGGAPCGVCHAIGGEGLAFTASLGPELSASLAGSDPEGLDGLLESLPFPTMAPIYEGRALTPGERADLAAFLIPAAAKGPPTGEGRLAAGAALLAALFVLVVALAGRRRKAPSRARLLASARTMHGGSR